MSVFEIENRPSVRFLFMITVLLFVVFPLSGCTLDTILKAGESGSKSYGIVKDANSLGEVAEGLGTLADTRKIKAETTQRFVKGVGALIANQPLDKQAGLISQSIEAKVSLALNDRYAGQTEGFSLSVILLGMLFILKFVINKIYPSPKTKETTY